MLIDFMGTWCGPCQRAVPVLHDLQDAYPELIVVSVSGTDTVEKVQDFQVRHSATWPHIVDNGTIVPAYMEAGTSARTMMWPSYALVVDGKLVFYNRGETLPATFTNAIDRHVARQAPPITSDVAGPATLAFVLGALAWFVPWLQEPMMSDRRPRHAWVLLAVMLLGIGALAGWASRPLSGRVATVAPFVAAAGVAAIVWWQWKGIRDVQGALAGTGWRHGWSLHGNWMWYAAPAWTAVLHAALLRTAPWESFGLLAAFLAGWAAVEITKPRWRARLEGVETGWLGAAALLISGAWNGLLWLR